MGIISAEFAKYITKCYFALRSNIKITACVESRSTQGRIRMLCCLCGQFFAVNINVKKITSNVPSFISQKNDQYLWDEKIFLKRCNTCFSFLDCYIWKAEKRSVEEVETKEVWRYVIRTSQNFTYEFWLFYNCYLRLHYFFYIYFPNL